ncbi:immunity protein Tsi6 family protein [Alkalimonas amylolytica]|uniref:Tsi6 domain-containing protein n=1 Tax=Alkalimonas amylolytica TaxID=152573 RepID=A0A1H4FNW7_ALKAM|nr:immunity protein Tsi6 family protein [Alkalimonas amylolytica]SEA98975.1 hypothetical protein SAMN04488051_1124 [Alkalimonas amylolytica]
MTPIEIVRKGISLTEKRLKDIPDFDIYQSIIKQLQYLLSIIDGSELDRSKLDKIIVGHFAVREFEESDPELAEILKNCQSIAFKLSLE